MKLSPLAEIKRDELAHAVCQALANPIIRSMYPSMSRGHAYDLFRDLYMTGFEKGYAFANEEKNERAEKLTEPFLATLITIQLKSQDGCPNVAKALEMAIAGFRVALAEYRQGSKE